MLFFLGLDSEFALLETVLTALYDGVPKMRKHKVTTVYDTMIDIDCFLSQGESDWHRLRRLFPGRSPLCCRWWPVHLQPDGHVRGRLRCRLDRDLGGHLSHVDLRIQELLQGPCPDDRLRAVLVLEDLLGLRHAGPIAGRLYTILYQF